jgi:dTDP-4-amino-4,6-dideoxygalactose transaminase
MPSLDRYRDKLHEIWERRWLTNEGDLHKELERLLAKYLDLKHLSLFCNGTIALLVALQSLQITDGEVITTPFTFPATPHVLYWNRVSPVFCDIDERTCNLDPNRIEPLITPKTKAILAVHVYGVPCDVESIQTIADKHGLGVIYDAAHAFGVRYKDRSLASYGDISVLSFHATKLFTTGEGGALICGSAAQKRHVDFLKNFGIADEETVIGPGINGKMNEFQAAFGLLQLESVDEEIERRGRLSTMYRKELKNLPGITCFEEAPDINPNHAYFPILVDRDIYGMSRDDLHTLLKEFNIFTRKYFSPLCSHYSCYSSLPSASPEKLPVAERISRQVLCLPIYGDLEEEAVSATCEVIGKLHEAVLGA